MISLSRIGAITFKELRQLRRDRLTFGMVVMIPLIQLLMFGYAINTNVRHLPVGLVDMSHSALARIFVQSISATQVVDFEQHYLSVQEAERGLTRGDVRAVLILPHDLAKRTSRHRMIASQLGIPARDDQQRALGQWIVDGSDTMVASTINRLRNMPLEDGRGILTQPAMNTFEVTYYFNPEQRSVVNIVPGLVAIILTMTMIMFTSAAIVREKERGNMELLITTPLRPIELMVGKIIPYIVIGLIQLTIVLSLGYGVFNVPMRGDIEQILLASLLFICASLTLGLIISTLAKSQLQSMQMTIFILLPSILLSGFMFPYEGMPEAAQWIAEVLPATHFMRMIRAIVLREADIVDVSTDALWLLGFTVVGLMIASVRFKKRLD
ncbi:MAG: ABC transporter permease [Halopseudomonas sp.]